MFFFLNLYSLTTCLESQFFREFNSNELFDLYFVVCNEKEILSSMNGILANLCIRNHAKSGKILKDPIWVVAL